LGCAKGAKSLSHGICSRSLGPQHWSNIVLPPNIHQGLWLLLSYAKPHLQFSSSSPGLADSISVVDTQLYTIIPYAVSTVTLPLACYLSDRFHNRSIPLLICLTVAVIGYIILITCTRRAVLVLGTCFAAGGTYPTTVLSATWVTTNHLGYTKRSTAWAVAQGSAQIFSIISTQIYRTPPRYYLGHGLLIGFLISAMLTTVFSALVMRQANRKKDERNEEFQERGELDPERLRGFEEVYDYHPGFRYNL
jgi:MFS family permease